MKIHEVISHAAVHNREVKVLGVFNKEHLPKLLFATGLIVDLGEDKIKKMISSLALNNTFTMGRKGYPSDLPLGDGRIYSRLHAVVLALGNDEFMILDTSLSGTMLSK